MPVHRLRNLLACLSLVAFLNCAGHDEIRLATERPMTTTVDRYDQLRGLSDDAARWYAAAERRTLEGVAKQARKSGPGVILPPPPSLAPYPTAVIPADLVPFFRCVIGHESAGAGVYLAVNPSGKYRGAYQMDVDFWRSYAPPEWVHLAGQHELAPPEAQDAAALKGYLAWRRGERGNPWSGPSGPICEEHAT